MISFVYPAIEGYACSDFLLAYTAVGLDLNLLTARVILRRVVYRWRNQCLPVGQHSALQTTGHWQVTINFPTYEVPMPRFEPVTSEVEGEQLLGKIEPSALIEHRLCMLCVTVVYIHRCWLCQK